MSDDSEQPWGHHEHRLWNQKRGEENSCAEDVRVLTHIAHGSLRSQKELIHYIQFVLCSFPKNLIALTSCAVM